ncbi:hypothetical protein Patl1_35074 [Pistacia atlantica]|uniref:Uncharacterized protein n=1 Tax=Pistacia atlantica TaxID=434234 RepID=A0ACC0ZSY7_9ROSI|nr:hypothetical protein Patl1_35074 [Pistacia atlantica]
MEELRRRGRQKLGDSMLQRWKPPITLSPPKTSLSGLSAFKQYVEDCKLVGFNTIELNVGSLEVPEETLLRYVRLIKSAGLKVKPQFAVKFNKV